MSFAIALLLASAAADGDRALGAQEQAGLARLACERAHRVAADDILVQHDRASGAAPADAALTVVVRCHPRGRIDGYRTRYRVRCARVQVQWQCEPGQFMLMVPVGSRMVELAMEGRISVRRAVSLLRHAASVTHFGVEDTTDWVQDVCRLRALDASSWELTCGDAQLQIAEDCVGNRCSLRLFLAEKHPAQAPDPQSLRPS